MHLGSFRGIIDPYMSDLCLSVPMEDGNKKEKRVSVSISLTDSEREELRGCAERHDLSLSVFLRLVAKEYVDNRKANQEGK